MNWTRAMTSVQAAIFRTNANLRTREICLRAIVGLSVFFSLLMTEGHGDEPVAVAAANVDGADVQDILFCSPRRPFLIRLHLSGNGQGFRRARRDWAEAQFAVYDVDKNGVLEGDELKRIPSPEALRLGRAVESSKIAPPDSDPADGKVTPAECRRYLLAASGTPFSIATQPSGVQANLFPKLDSDQDGKLSREEILGAAAKLRRYDQNEDDVISANELQQSVADEQALTQQKLSGVLGMLAVVDASDHGLAASRRLLESYDKASRDPATKTFRKDERLTKNELLIEPDLFERADLNHDGKLDRIELGQLSFVMPPSVELAIEAPSAAGVFLVSNMRPSDPAHATSISVTQEVSGPLLLVLNETAFSLTATKPAGDIEQELRSTYKNQFKNLDRDKNDYLDLAEMNRFGFQETFFSQADVDGDGKVFEKEYEAHIEREIELSKTAFVLEVGGDGRSLFRLIDAAPADGRLTLRELADASARLNQWDGNGDGMITLTELSIALNGVFRSGTPRVSGPFGVGRTRVVESMGGPRRQSTASTSLPAWFIKMDRNSDGDLSPNEFLGRRALFDTIDKDDDGLISAEEATAVPK
ncbi:hypothetical protein [Schlesneria paludicola]|uniref:hypothetical protein n=1 Tax=Schlesneria paludicola TaxID=360056 RepID=UPI00029AFE0F|nr:hypothetical protein [Schlesneria paludicola]